MAVPRLEAVPTLCVAFLLTALILLACYLPASRVCSIDPAVTLRRKH